MTFGRRLRLYFVGVILGFLIVYVSLIKNRDRNLLGWLPENRVLEQITTSEMVISEELKDCFGCLNYSIESFLEMIRNAKVNFNLSENKSTDCPLYVLEFEGDHQIKSLWVESCETKSTIKKIGLSEPANCNCK